MPSLSDVIFDDAVLSRDREGLCGYCRGMQRFSRVFSYFHIALFWGPVSGILGENRDISNPNILCLK
jgi:hypothetical protein